MSYDAPLGEETTEEVKDGKIYRSSDPLNTYYKVSKYEIIFCNNLGFVSSYFLPILQYVDILCN